MTQPSPPDVVIDALLKTVAEQGWSAVGVRSLLDDTGVPASSFYRHFDGRYSVVLAVSRRLSAQMLDSLAGWEADDSARDKLFEAIMARFDAALPHKGAVRALLRAAPADPLLAATLAVAMQEAMRRVLEAADLPSGGLAGLIRCQALAVAYGQVVRVWLDDDTADQARTMAALDKHLSRLERLARGFGPRRATTDEEAAAPPEPAPPSPPPAAKKPPAKKPPAKKRPAAKAKPKPKPKGPAGNGRAKTE